MGNSIKNFINLFCHGTLSSHVPGTKQLERTTVNYWREMG